MRLLRGNLWSVLQPSDKNTFKDKEIHIFFCFLHQCLSGSEGTVLFIIKLFIDTYSTVVIRVKCVPALLGWANQSLVPNS